MTARLAVRVQPGARSPGLVGWMSDGSLKLKVAAAPEGGRANRAVLELLAEALGVAPARLSLARGAGSRTKWIEVDGLDERQTRARLDLAMARRGE